MVEVTGKDGITYSYHLDKRMKAFLDEKVKNLINHKDKDYVMLIDGYEGSGKSTFGMQIAKYVDPDLDLSRVCLKSEEFRKAIYSAKKGQAVIYDEAVTGMSAGESITKIGRMLKSMMMQMRQKNLFVIIILPSVFELNKYAVLSRARSFFHIYEKSGRMGYWVGYNKKDTRRLYLLGKKTHSYRVRSFFNGRFYGKTVVNEEEYRKKKEECLSEVDEDDVGMHRWMIQRNFVIKELKKRGVGVPEMTELMKKAKYPIKTRQLYDIVKDSDKKYYKTQYLEVDVP